MSEKKADQLQDLIIEGMRNLKGRNITVIDMEHVPGAGVARAVICEGTSTMHVAGVADSVRDYLLEQAHIKPLDYDGYREARWIVIDYGEAMAHVFMPEERQRYALEELWSDAKIQNFED